ncbi:MAG: hypothetical protein Q9222_002202 [Ikaeria aurantiellina]
MFGLEALEDEEVPVITQRTPVIASQARVPQSESFDTVFYQLADEFGTFVRASCRAGRGYPRDSEILWRGQQLLGAQLRDDPYPSTYPLRPAPDIPTPDAEDGEEDEDDDAFQGGVTVT